MGIAELLAFAFWYPVAMSFLWLAGGVYYYLRRERGKPLRDQPPRLEPAPSVSILVPCHNEGGNVDGLPGSPDHDARLFT